MRVDLNSDVGESFGPWAMGDDAGVIPHVTSANVACGFHAGDPSVMRRTAALALEHGVAVGAHPGLPDLAGFGRRRMQLAAGEAYDLVVYQIGALAAVVTALGGRLRHVKPHGALYNMAAAEPALAEAIARAVRAVDGSLLLYGLAGSVLLEAGAEAGLGVVAEAFPDRGYAADGSLLPRSHPQALVRDPADAADRALRMVRDGVVIAANGSEVAITPGTLCVHGDAPEAAATARAIRARLASEGVGVAAPDARGGAA